jgi:hypothetical protein
VKETWHGVGEVEVVAGLDLGQGEARLVICRHGRDLGGCSALVEVSADGGWVTHLIHGSVQDFRGFQDGGGSIHNME